TVEPAPDVCSSTRSELRPEERAAAEQLQSLNWSRKQLDFGAVRSIFRRRHDDPLGRASDRVDDESLADNILEFGIEAVHSEAKWTHDAFHAGFERLHLARVEQVYLLLRRRLEELIERWHLVAARGGCVDREIVLECVVESERSCPVGHATLEVSEASVSKRLVVVQSVWIAVQIERRSVLRALHVVVVLNAATEVGAKFFSELKVSADDAGEHGGLAGAIG